MQYLLTGTCFVACCLLKLLKWNCVPILQKNNKEQHRIQNITVYSFYIELQYCVWEMHYFYREPLCLFFFFSRNFSTTVLYWKKNWRNTTCPLWLFAVMMTSFLSWILIREARLFAYRRSVVCISSPSGEQNNTLHFPHGRRKERHVSREPEKIFWNEF